MVWLAAMRTLLRAIEFGSFPKAAAGESPCAARTGSVAALLANASLGAGLFLSTTFEILSAMPETASCQRADLMPNEIVSSFGCRLALGLQNSICRRGIVCGRKP